MSHHFGSYARLYNLMDLNLCQGVLMHLFESLSRRSNASNLTVMLACMNLNLHRKSWMCRNKQVLCLCRDIIKRKWWRLLKWTVIHITLLNVYNKILAKKKQTLSKGNGENPWTVISISLLKVCTKILAKQSRCYQKYTVKINELKVCLLKVCTKILAKQSWCYQKEMVKITELSHVV